MRGSLKATSCHAARRLRDAKIVACGSRSRSSTRRVGDLAANARGILEPSRAGAAPAARARRHARALAVRLSARGPRAASRLHRRLRRELAALARAGRAAKRSLVGFPEAPDGASLQRRWRCCATARVAQVYRKHVLAELHGVRRGALLRARRRALRLRRRRRARRPRHLRGRLVPGAGRAGARRRRAGASSSRTARPTTRGSRRCGARRSSARAREMRRARSCTSIASAARTSSCSTARRSSWTRGGALAQQLPAWHETVALVEFDGAAAARTCAARSTSGSSRTSTRRWSWACATTWTRTAFRACCSGLSGGVDSALTLAIAVDALGRDRVRALMLPSPYNASISLEDAREMAAIVGVRYDEIPIEPVFAAFLGGAGAASSRASRPTRPRRTSRRASAGTLLMALSNKYGSIVLTTGNKSEMAVGYATLYGDMAGGFAVLKDISKTLVYRLCALSQPAGPRDPGAHHHPRAVGRAASRTRRTRTRCRPTTCWTASSKRTSSSDRSPAEIVAMGFRRGGRRAGRAPHQGATSTSAGSRRWASASRRAGSARTGAIRSRRRGTSEVIYADPCSARIV